MDLTTKIFGQILASNFLTVTSPLEVLALLEKILQSLFKNHVTKSNLSSNLFY